MELSNKNNPMTTFEQCTVEVFTFLTKTLLKVKPLETSQFTITEKGDQLAISSNDSTINLTFASYEKLYCFLSENGLLPIWQKYVDEFVNNHYQTTIQKFLEEHQ